MNKPKATRAWTSKIDGYVYPHCSKNKTAAEYLRKDQSHEVIEVEILPVEEVEAMRNEIKELRSILVQFVFESRNCCYENESYKKSEIYLEEKKVYDTLNQAKDKV